MSKDFKNKADLFNILGVIDCSSSRNILRNEAILLLELTTGLTSQGFCNLRRNRLFGGNFDLHTADSKLAQLTRNKVREYYAVLRLRTTVKGCQYAFPKFRNVKNGYKSSPADISRIFAWISSKTGYHLTLQGLRKHFATKLLHETGNFLVVKEVLNQHSIYQTKSYLGR